MAKSEEPWRLSFSEMVSPIEDIIEEARNGRMFILVDDESRENEGDLVIPAQMATPDAINFMARYGRGLICLAMVRQRIEALGLPLMSSKNESRHQRSEEHTSELQSLMRISYAVFCLKKKKEK